MRTLKLTLAYDGTDLVGWQRQARGASVQGLLEEALGRIADRSVEIAGAGRTDAGVHAIAQVASCQLESALALNTLQRALNAALPAAVRVLQIAEAPDGFHARFSAVSKTYRYYLLNGPVLSPFLARYVWHVRSRLDPDVMRAALATAVGTHDFAALQSTGSDVTQTVRTIRTATLLDGEQARHGIPAAVHHAERLLAVEVSADGFLRHMVRALVGTLVEIGNGRRRPDALADVIAGRQRAAAGPTAPACGLWLVRVDY